MERVECYIKWEKFEMHVSKCFNAAPTMKDAFSHLKSTVSGVIVETQTPRLTNVFGIPEKHCTPHKSVEPKYQQDKLNIKAQVWMMFLQYMMNLSISNLVTLLVA